MKKKIFLISKAATTLVFYILCPHVSKAQRFSLGAVERVFPYMLSQENYFSVPFDYRDKVAVRFDEKNNATYIAPLFDANGNIHQVLWQIGADGRLSFVGLSSELKGVFGCKKPLAFYQSCIQEITKEVYSIDFNKETIACLVNWLNFCER